MRCVALIVGAFLTLQQNGVEGALGTQFTQYMASYATGNCSGTETIQSRSVNITCSNLRQYVCDTKNQVVSLAFQNGTTNCQGSGLIQAQYQKNNVCMSQGSQQSSQYLNCTKGATNDDLYDTAVYMALPFHVKVYLSQTACTAGTESMMEMWIASGCRSDGNNEYKKLVTSGSGWVDKTYTDNACTTENATLNSNLTVFGASCVDFGDGMYGTVTYTEASSANSLSFNTFALVTVALSAFTFLF